MMIANKERPPYQRLAPSVMDAKVCLRLYSVRLEKSDLKRSKASSSLLECRRVSVPRVESDCEQQDQNLISALHIAGFT